MSSASKRLKIFAHDAGSGNATFAYAKQLAKAGYYVEAFGKGPSEKIFQKEIPEFLKSSEPVFHPDDLVVTGLSGVHSKYELQMVKAAKAAGVRKTISIMDIPYNLDMRFQVDGKFLQASSFPDEIWVAKLAERSLNPEIEKRLVVKQNPYWDYVKETQYGSPPKITDKFIRKHQGKYVLYLTDYLSEQYGDSLGFTELTLLEDFLIIHTEISPELPILFRQHPAEAAGKYDKILSGFPDLIYAFSKGPLNEALWYSILVCGSLSSVFYESTLIKKPTLSLQFNAMELRKRAPDGVEYLSNKEELAPKLANLK